MSIVIITGSRDWQDSGKLIDALGKEHAKEPITLLVEGGANGADTLAAQWATRNGIAVDTIPADWALHGKKAGVIRNCDMLSMYPTARVIAFPLPQSKGTVHCMKEAKNRGMQVINYGYIREME